MYRKFVSSCPCIYLFNYFYQYGFMEIYFTLWVIIKYCLILFAPIFPDLFTGTSFIWLLGPFDLPPSLWVSFLLLLSLSTYLFSSTTRYSRFIWYISWTIPRISHFSKDPWFLWLEDSIRDQDLGSRYACCYKGTIVYGFSQLSEEGNICVYPKL